MRNNKFILFYLLILLLILSNCSDEDYQSPYAMILSFLPEGIEYDMIRDSVPDVDGTEHKYVFKVPYGTDITDITPEIMVSLGANIDPEDGVEQDFTSQMSYTVKAANGWENIWTVYAMVIDHIGLEEMELDGESFWNGDAGSGDFSSGNAIFSNNFNSNDDWSGFGYSNLIEKASDNTEYLAYSFSGSTFVPAAEEDDNGGHASNNYGLCNIGNEEYTSIHFNNSVLARSISLCNTANVYNYINNVENIFGGIEDDLKSDSLIIVVKGYNSGVEVWSEEFFLADYRLIAEDSEVAQNQEIIDEFTSLSFISDVSDYNDLIIDELRFSMISSDSNIPKQFCFDELVCEVQHGDVYQGLDP